MARAIGTLGTIPSLTIGGRVYTDLDNLIILSAGTSTSGNTTMFRKGTGSAGYPVTASKTLTITSLVMYNKDASANVNEFFGYADTDLGYNSGSAAVNPVYFAGAGSATEMWIGLDTTLGQSTRTINLHFQIPAGKYLFVTNNGAHATNYFAYGYEA